METKLLPKGTVPYQRCGSGAAVAAVTAKIEHIEKILMFRTVAAGTAPRSG